MTFFYENTDMTRYAQIDGCVYRDNAGKMDMLEITLGNAADWHGWRPKTDDVIHVEEDGFDTGAMFLQSVKPEDGRFILRAVSVPSKAARRSWTTFEDATMAQIMARCAGESGMGWQLYGVDGSMAYPFLLRQNEGPAGFMQRMAEREGATLKCVNGGMRMIGTRAASERTPVAGLDISADQPGVKYKKDETMLWSSLTVVSGDISVTAYDRSVQQEKPMAIAAPAGNIVNANRWARNLLMEHNRQAETLTVQAGLDLRMTAMSAVQVTGGTEMDGLWLVKSAEHDLIERQSVTTMERAVK